MSLKVALVHDDLFQWGGAERVLAEMARIFPDATIYTSVFNFENRNLVKAFEGREIVTSFMQKIPFWKNFYKVMLPLYGLAFEQFDFSGYDVVISQSTRFAKDVVTKPETIHICYCHTPPRFLWNFSSERVSAVISLYLSYRRIADQIFAKRVDFWLAGSKNASDRISKIYKAKSRVLYPFVEDKFFNSENRFDGGYYLVIARLTKYKRVDLAVKAFSRLGLRLKVVGSGSELKKLRLESAKNVEFLSNISDDLLLSLLEGCRGVVVCAEEDFGLVSLEAQAMGKGVIAYRGGGALESVVEDVTGVFFDEQKVESLERAVEKYEKLVIEPNKCVENAKRFSRARFESELRELTTSALNLSS